eukprot:6212038-Pleurochrysis_carterae.AAC.1
MAGIGVAVALDRDEGRVGWQVDGWVKALSFIAEQAGRQDQVASLVKFVVVGVALAVLGRLQRRGKEQSSVEARSKAERGERLGESESKGTGRHKQ